METSDARKLVSAALEERRKLVIRLYRGGKYKTYQEIAEVSGVHRNTASQWIRRWEKGGSLKTQQRGRPVGCCRRLLAYDEDRIRKDFVDHCPDQLHLPFALWTRQAVRLHIKASFGQELPIRTVGEYLKRWGFTPQKPIKRVYQRSDAAVQDWLENKFPVIKKQAKAEDADIFWGDETGIRNDESKGRRHASVPEKINMISAISNQGKVHFMFYKETMSAQKLIEFMERIIRSNERKVFLILDNLRVHHSKALNDFLVEQAAFIKIFHLPRYSPDLNPDEYLNRDLKSNLNNKPLGRAKGKIEEYAKDHMESVTRNARSRHSTFPGRDC